MSLANFFTGFGAADQITGNQNPGIGDRVLAGMMASQGNLEQMVDNQKRITAGGKAADSFREFIGGDDEAALGVHDAQWKNMDPRSKMAVVQDYMGAQQAKEQNARMQEFAAQAQQRAQGAVEDQTAFQLFNEFTKANGSEPDAPLAPRFLNPDGTVNEQGAAMKAFANVGQNPKAALNARSVATFQKMVEGAGGEGNTPKVTMLPVGSPGDDDFHTVPWISQGKVGEVDPGYALGIRQKNAETLIDDKAAAAPDKGAITPVDQYKRLQAKQKSLITAQGTALSDASKKAYQDQIDALDQQMAALETAGKTAADKSPAAATPLPMPTNKADMQKGKQYQTSKGVYTWDGTQFVK